MHISQYWKRRITVLWSILAPIKTSALSTLDTTNSKLGTKHQTALSTLIFLLPFIERTCITVEYSPRIMKTRFHLCCALFWIGISDLTHTLQDQCTGIKATIWLSQCQWGDPEEYGLVSEMIPPRTSKPCIYCGTYVSKWQSSMYILLYLYCDYQSLQIGLSWGMHNQWLHSVKLICNAHLRKLRFFSGYCS